MIERVPLWLAIAILFAAMVIAYEAGMRLHRRLRPHADASERGSSDESYAMSYVFGLLALLMAFSFSLAVNRYEERRHLVTEEANAIGTFAARLAVLDEADRAPIRRELAAYAAARLDAGLHEAGDGRAAALARADASRDQVQASLYAALGRLPADARLTLLAPAFDRVADIATERQAARDAHLPDMVMALLALYCVMGSMMLGYAVAGEEAHHRISAGVAFLLLAFAFAAVLDLDRPRGGVIMVSQQPMEAVAAKLGIR